MKQAIHFTYDGISSEEMGVFIAWDSTGLFEENFLPSRKIIEKKITGNEKPYYFGVEHSPLSFPLSFVLDNWTDRRYLRDVASWFFQDRYKPLIFETSSERIFYAMFEGESKMFHNGAKEGYVELNVRCNSPYSYSETKTIELFSDTEIMDTVDVLQQFNTSIRNNLTQNDNGEIVIESPKRPWGVFYTQYKTWGDTK